MFVIVQILILTVSVLCGSYASAQSPDNTQRASVPLKYLPSLSGDYFELHSDVIGHPFHIYVRLPEDYSDNPEKLYPVVYTLDGDSLFPILAANHLFLTFDEDLPEAIIVGIAYGSFNPTTNKRGYDFSAPAADASPDEGGADLFHEFLELELLPDVESGYRADPNRRILFGQSRGGYMMLYSAFTRPDLFWGRIANNPTFNPGRERFFSSASAANKSDLSVMVTSGSRDYPSLRADALAWFEEWENRSDTPWTLKTETIEGGTHSANSATSYRLGMLWLFNRD